VAADDVKSNRGLPVGVASASYGARFAEDRQPGGVRDALGFLRFCRERGAAGVQTAITGQEAEDPAPIRRYLDETGMWLEGTVHLPLDRFDVERFTASVVAAKKAGATVVRTAMLNGRRYEAFDTPADFERFRKRSEAAVLLAAPVMAREKVRLAIENHKDLRTEEFLALLKRVGSEYVGATVDTGNNLALLEEPLATIQALAPYAWSVHLKDMGVQECPEGFLLSEVPFGEGALDLREIVRVLRQSRPEIRFNVEMITRDPLVVPCLTDHYWSTLGQLPGHALAQTLSFVRSRKTSHPLPRTAGLSTADRLKLEDENVRRCIDYARTRLAT
jgi:sugar phosphate isomerase/epimerase